MTEIRPIQAGDIVGAKALADAHRPAIGFITRQRFQEVVQQGRALVAVEGDQVVGFVIYRHRQRDRQTTLLEICVDVAWQRQHVGTRLVDSLVADCRGRARAFVQLKCPANLPANGFYRRLGFVLHGVEAGKTRLLNVWRLPISEDD